MKRVLLITVTAIIFLLLTGCINGDEGQLEPIEDTGDIETLISTNQQLVQQIESYKDENTSLQEQVKELEEENRSLKDNILTYRQELIEKDNLREEELVTRDYLDELAKEIFQAMNDRDHYFLEGIVAENIQVNANAETLDMHDENGRLYYTFHYISLDSVNYIRQTSFNYDFDEEVFESEYSLTTGDSKDYTFDGGIKLTFIYEDEWRLSSIVR
ncbi:MULTISPECIES: hypothetical protein [Bacillaceae]|uniref:Uncharacterized protein n=1 Tax=Evansella alkalicola TaxID=745819 RepID=A0ABS6JUD5_9BACI|nr:MULTISPECIES: hypothetical protein [Bacillaceae]MBU9721867.1 hypothetical protein [Bacillus alkalicola]